MEYLRLTEVVHTTGRDRDTETRKTSLPDSGRYSFPISILVTVSYLISSDIELEGCDVKSLLVDMLPT